MDRREPSIRNFIAAFRGHWLQAMSGGFSVPFAIGAVFVSSGAAKIVMLAMAFGGAWWAAYTVWAAERETVKRAEARVAELESQYAHCLRLGAIDYNLLLHSALDGGGKPTGMYGERRMGFTIHIINTINRPVQYRFKKIAIDGVETVLGNDSEVISPNISTQFTTETIPTLLNISHSPEQFLLDLEYCYGEPGNLTRHVKKRIKLSIFHDTKKTTYGYEFNEEESVSR